MKSCSETDISRLLLDLDGQNPYFMQTVLKYILVWLPSLQNNTKSYLKKQKYNFVKSRNQVPYKIMEEIDPTPIHCWQLLIPSAVKITSKQQSQGQI